MKYKIEIILEDNFLCEGAKKIILDNMDLIENASIKKLVDTEEPAIWKLNKQLSNLQDPKVREFLQISSDIPRAEVPTLTKAELGFKDWVRDEVRFLEVQQSKVDFERIGKCIKKLYLEK